MTIIRRPNTNYIQGENIAIAKADNPGLDAVDVTISAKRGLLATWAGPLPTVTGAGLEFLVPTVSGSTATFNLATLKSRLSALPSGSTSFRAEKSTGGGAFTPVTIATLTHTSSDYDKSNTGLTGTVQSGDTVRLYFSALAGNGGVYNVQLTAEEA